MDSGRASWLASPRRRMHWPEASRSRRWSEEAPDEPDLRGRAVEQKRRHATATATSASDQVRSGSARAVSRACRACGCGCEQWESSGVVGCDQIRPANAAVPGKRKVMQSCRRHNFRAANRGLGGGGEAYTTYNRCTREHRRKRAHSPFAMMIAILPSRALPSTLPHDCVHIKLNKKRSCS